jgi:hypothetical protein
MPKREDDIRNEILRMDGGRFERFARELLSRELFPGLNPTSQTHDLGEDARTEPTTYFLHGNKWISLAASKDDSFTKLKADCDRCRETKRKVDIFVFVTAGNPRTDIVEKWSKEVNGNYGWDLEIRSIDFLAPFASRPQYESLVDDYLLIPPPGGDYVQDAIDKFSRPTSRYLEQIRITIPGMDSPLSRNEVETIEDQLSLGRHVVVTGEAGTGKSVIAALLARNAKEAGKIVFFIDARRVGNLQTEGELRSFFDLKGPVHLAISRISRYIGCRFIIDQLDNIAGSESATLIIDLIEECSQNSSNLEMVVVCRNKEQHERELLTSLISIGFIELICREINGEEVECVLKKIGIGNYSPEVIELGRNLLNLELMGQIHIQQPGFDFSTLTDEVYLWEEYINSWRAREGRVGEEMLSEATNLARLGLNHPDGMFTTTFPAPQAIMRLESWGIIALVEGRVYRFRHEKFQDFIYARDAADRRLMPRDILEEILEYKSRNVFGWVLSIHAHRQSPIRLKFLQEVFNV